MSESSKSPSPHKGARRAPVAVAHYFITPNNPAGSCIRHMLKELCEQETFVVFAVEFDNPCPDRIRWVRVPAPRRPLAVLFLTFCAVASIAMLIDAILRRRWYSQVIFTESRLPMRGIAYVHFCHRAYVRRRQQRNPRSITELARSVNHRVHAICEPWVYKRATRVVVPSLGLQDDLVREYPEIARKVLVISNPVDTDSFRRPANRFSTGIRRRLSIPETDLVFAFVALGNFEHKGLNVIIEALARESNSTWWLLVVGGRNSSLARYKELAATNNVEERICFAGFQHDVRPYLWESDAFVFPSMAEVFPLACLQAAAAGLPLVCTPVHGVSEFIVDGVTGFFVDRNVESVRAGMARLAALTSLERQAFGERARIAAGRYGVADFAAAWAKVLWSVPGCS